MIYPFPPPLPFPPFPPVLPGASLGLTLFAEDVQGTVDLSTNFDSRELSIEYLYGVFGNNVHDPSEPSPFGTPLSYNVTRLVVAKSIVASSIVFDVHFGVLNKSYPIQADNFIYVNDKKQIQQYDVMFRRWAWASDYIVPQVIPFMGQTMNMTSTNETFILQQFISRKTCRAAIQHCTGGNLQYETYDGCMDFLTNKPIGHWYRMGEDNLLCRHLHLPMLTHRPDVHCPHVGPSGGDMCVPRDYTSVVLDKRFDREWIAPKVVTPENADEVAGISTDSSADFDPLLDIAMNYADLHSWSPSLYPVTLLCYFLGYYLLARIISQVLQKSSDAFNRLALEHKRNVVTYIMTLIITTIALALQLAAAPSYAGTYSLWGVDALRAAGVLVSALYIFELVYRLQMRLPLIIHHFLTIFAIFWTVCVFEYTSSMSFMVSASIWLFQATTEQPSFLGLLGYRLSWSPKSVSRLLRFAAIQTFVLKSASGVGVIVWWGSHQRHHYRAIDYAWTIILFLVAVSLLLTQVWGSWVTWQLAMRIEYKSYEQAGPSTQDEHALYAQVLAASADGGAATPEASQASEHGKMSR